VPLSSSRACLDVCGPYMSEFFVLVVALRQVDPHFKGL
jgi:hypothetical protein